jgi:hypothetical protein
MDHKFYGITQDPETKICIMVLNEKCKKCNYICDAIHFQQNFGNWTSGNDDIDKFIQNTQLLTHEKYKIFENALEWIPYDRFYNIKYIAQKKVYMANWIDGSLGYWSSEYQNWKRVNQNMIIILKQLNNSKNITPKFLNKVQLIILLKFKNLNFTNILLY